MKSFVIDIPRTDLDDLRDRLRRTRWAGQLPGGWSRGVPVDHLRELAAYWADGFDWRAQEARLNAFPQYTTDIDGQSVHFVHARSPEPGAVPLIVTHSWPNSVAEFMNVIGPLSDPRAHGLDPSIAFHVVAPSLPGFGFSPFPEPADERPWSIERVARTWAELMSRLGYERYGAHGNDAGALVTPRLAALDTEHVIGSHITGGLGIPTGDPAELADASDEERETARQIGESWAGGSGYGPYLSNRPQTLAFGFADSPVMQLAYLVERFKEFDGWPGGKGEVAEPVDRDLLLTNASIYWFTGTGGSSSWTYYEGAAGLPIDQTGVPTGVSHGGPDLFRRLAERRNHVVHWAGEHSPSHMVAMASPQSLVRSLRTFFALIA
ncbi:epoxide hydrolase family protein [Nonomuraea rhodomycinica]|uniref:Epoxide hydrolase N-terminal domain-containing protein n=1 Tax=Nonomuraea rhodomycinica TaxID=1712872 RepID=A0A7Y6M9L2_9ACTN|nr:epoxide hydrolase family protein [Nonomuraea rhodomycinica]NUW39737.1 epoxide hydrolase N-terminal domain-containing protein [Nonomuraea rhodomycinica]